ncbi:MAG: hypothetical protein IPL53_15515 [Ignavibacteria bacterium]|nr:hypothetical protein [Ignavibacteria bacterium]
MNSETTSINGLWNLTEINGQKPDEGNYMTEFPTSKLGRLIINSRAIPDATGQAELFR